MDSFNPAEEQPEPEHLRRLKAEINHRWSTLPLLDVLKETEFRLNFTTHFRSAASRETLDPDELRKRLLLCLYALGTNLGIKRIAHGDHGASARDLHYVRRKFLSKAALRQLLPMWPMPSFIFERPISGVTPPPLAPLIPSSLALGTRTS